MGLLGKALSARSEEPRPRGLLGKSIEITHPPSGGMLVTQQELDALLNSRPKEIHPSAVPAPRGAAARPAASVPLTWNAAGLSVPEHTKGPEISQDELELILGHGSRGPEQKELPSAEALSAAPEELPATSSVAVADGLLASAERSHQPSSPQAAADQSEDSLISGLLPSLRSLPQGIELPAAVFSQMVESLSLSKAAILLYDPLRLVYAPWASVGYDETTLHRLRIPLGANASFNSISNATPAVISGREDLDPYLPYFSSREFSQLATILLVPFIHEEKLIGVLLVSESQGPLAGTKDLIRILSAAAGQAAPMIHSAREEKLRSLLSSPTADGDPGGRELDGFLERARSDGRKVLLLSFSLSGLLEAVTVRVSHIDSFRLREDLRLILDGFLSGLGKAFPLPASADLWLLAITDGKKTDVPLLLHQLAAHLERIFAGIKASSTMDPSSARAIGWPEECGDVREILSRFTA